MTSGRPRVSAVIDNYNYGRFLSAALDSVLSQDFPSEEIEIIVVDDGSTDNSRQVLERYAPRVKAVFQPNQGQATTFNRGFAEAHGEIVCLLDSDDVWLPQKVSKVVRTFDQNPKAGVVQNDLYDTDIDLKPYPKDPPAWPPIATLEDFLEGRFIFSATSGLSYRKSFLDKALPIPKDLFYYLDNYLTAHTLFLAQAANISEVLGYHRVHGSNFCAEGYANTRKLATDFKMRQIFRESLDRWLSTYGRKLSPRYERLEDMDVLRREILFHMQERRRGKAAAAWLRGVKRYSGDPFGAFRIVTCALALISPRFYLGTYQFYARSRFFKTLRLRLFPI